MVGTGGEPIYEVTLLDSAKVWFSQNGDEFIFALLLGIGIGIGLSWIFCKIRAWLSQKEDEEE